MTRCAFRMETQRPKLDVKEIMLDTRSHVNAAQWLEAQAQPRITLQKLGNPSPAYYIPLPSPICAKTI